MQISVHVTIAEGEHYAWADYPDQAAAQVLAALGGDPTKDTCVHTLTAATAPGIAGPSEPDPPA